MERKFNVTGTCFPEDHYMADASKKWAKTYRMIEEGSYFTINRPRQYGKTTTLYTLNDMLINSGNYLVFNISFEGIGDSIFEDESLFAPGFVRLLARDAAIYDKDRAAAMREMAKNVVNLDTLSTFITDYTRQAGKKVVVMIDEVDKSSNNQLFVSFLAMLRNKYLDRKKESTFHSVVLAGVYDVKTLKLKINPDTKLKNNSPWNIAEEFNVNMDFNPSEIKPMLDDYAAERGIKMDTAAIAERLFYFTSGYPFLVSYMCKIIDEDILPEKMVHPDTIGSEETNKEWTIEDVNEAFHLILRKDNNANFDTLMKNLEQYPDLYELVFALIFSGERMEYRKDNPTINLGTLHGIFGPTEEGMLKIHSRIYRERIANMMISVWRTSNLGQQNRNTDVFDYTSQYRLPNNGLNMQKVLENFQIFMKKEYNTKDRKFLERDGRLIFLAFMRPILNGAGYDFKEPQVSEEKRLDIVITYHQHQYVAELKLWYGPAANEEGLLQLADYLDRAGLDTGYLIIFDHSQRKSWKKDWKDVGDKRIFWVKV